MNTDDKATEYAKACVKENNLPEWVAPYLESAFCLGFNTGVTDLKEKIKKL